MVEGAETDRRWKCQLCKRQKFTHKTPHRCGPNYRARKIPWELVVFVDVD